VIGRPVRVKLNSGIEYRGVLACLDGYLNIAMEQTEEFENGQLKARYGDCMIRGNNGTRKTNSLAFVSSPSRMKLTFFLLPCTSYVHLHGANQETIGEFNFLRSIETSSVLPVALWGLIPCPTFAHGGCLRLLAARTLYEVV
jgi:U6 snRNA-associated Sm-like protein LSm6